MACIAGSSEVSEDGDIALEHLAAWRILPAGQVHVGPFGVGATIDDFGRRLARRRKMQLVLNDLEEQLRLFAAALLELTR